MAKTAGGRGGNEAAGPYGYDVSYGTDHDYAARIFRLRYLMKEREVYYEKKNK